MKSSASKIQLTGFNDLFQMNGDAETSGERVQEIPLSDLFPFKDHPFQVRDDEAMRETADSIAKHGVLVPGIVRPRQEGGYEIIAGHRRKRGSELAGKETMPVLVRTLDDDEATIIMVDSNLQREKILPSEKAFAYKMKLEALKHQGKRRDLTSAPAVQKLTTRDKIAQDAGEKSGMAVTRYISLTRLISPLLVLVDEEKLSLSSAADYISDLSKSEQMDLITGDGQTKCNSREKSTNENQAIQQGWHPDPHPHREHSVSGSSRRCAGNPQTSKAAPILPAVLYRPADGGSNCVPAGNLEIATTLKEPPQQPTIQIRLLGRLFCVCGQANPNK